MTKELKICPFCGVELDTISFYAHPTNGCLLQHVYFAFDDEHAIEAWNRREPIDKIVEQLEDLKEDAEWDCEVSLDDRHKEIAINREAAFLQAIDIVKKGGAV